MGSNVGSDIGSNPQAFVIRFSIPTFKQARSLANLRVSSKGWGDYMCTVNKTQRGQLNVRERAKPDAKFAELKDA